MPKVRTKRLQYDEIEMQKALDAVKLGMPIRKAATAYNVPKSTLSDKHNKKVPETRSVGGKTVLSTEDEDEIVAWLLRCSEMGFPMTKSSLLNAVRLFVMKTKLPNPFTNNCPGRSWYKAFLKRHSEVAVRISQNLTRSRANVTIERLEKWFDEVFQFLQKNGLLHIAASRIFNSDETAFYLSPKGEKVLAKRGSRSVHSVVGNDKECLTTLVTASADGRLLPSLVLFKYERFPSEIIHNFPAGWGIGKSKSGWMTAEHFFEYVANVFYPWLVANEIQLPVILFVDGHSSHMSMPLSDFCLEKGIVLTVLYPNATHILQPLDVALFRPLKLAWTKEVAEYRVMENGGMHLKPAFFAKLLQRTLNSMDLRPILINGFRTCGLYPFSFKAINLDKIIGEKTNKSSEDEKKEIAEYPLETYDAMDKMIQGYLPLGVEKSFERAKEEGVWKGPVQFESLFYFWLKVKKLQASCLNTRVENSTEEEEDDEELTSNSIAGIWLVNEDGTLTSMHSLPSTCEEVLNEELNHENVSPETSPTVPEEPQPLPCPENRNKEEVPNPLENQSNSLPSLNPIQSAHNKKRPLEEEPLNHEPDTKSLSNTKSSQNEGSLENVHFKDCVYWPSTEKTTAKRRRAPPGPAVVIGDQWRDLKTAQENAKKKLEAEKEERKQKRIANKRLKEEELLKKAEAKKAKEEKKQQCLMAKKIKKEKLDEQETIEKNKNGSKGSRKRTRAAK